jgi:hypothetical protein
MNKYAAGGKCGSMSPGGKVTGSQVKEVNSNLSALMAERNKLDSLWQMPPSKKQDASASASASASAIVLAKASGHKKETRDSDIDFILGGDC